MEIWGIHSLYSQQLLYMSAVAESSITSYKHGPLLPKPKCPKDVIQTEMEKVSS